MAKTVLQSEPNFFKADLQLIKSEITASFDISHDNDERNSQGRAKLLRSSMLPYCPLREFAEVLENGEPISEINLESLYYLGTGTLTHSIFQSWLPSTFEKVTILGRWDANAIDCQIGNCPHKSKYNILEHDSTGCGTCGNSLPYIELESFGKYTSHIDGVYVIKGTKRVYIIDYKTTSLIALMLYNKGKGWIPQNAYIMQLDSYIVSLYKLLTAMGYEIHGSLLMYIPRDKPSKWQIIPIREQRITEKWIAKKQERLHRIADGWRHMSKIIKADEFTLKNASMCNKHKLCSSGEYYDKYVADSFKEPCPLRDVCFNGPKLKQRLQSLING